MTETAAIVHSTFTIERTVAASPSRVFRAFADIEVKSRCSHHRRAGAWRAASQTSGSAASNAT